MNAPNFPGNVNNIPQYQQRINELEQQRYSNQAASPAQWNGASPLQSVATQLPQTQQAPMPITPPIGGRIVRDIKEVMPNEVPMDGSIRLFLKQDLSTVWARAWNGQGYIDTAEYVLNKPVENSDTLSTSEFQTMVVNRLNEMQSKLDELIADKAAREERWQKRSKSKDGSSKNVEVSENA